MTGSLIEGFGLGGVFPAGQYSLVKTYHVTFVQKFATSCYKRSLLRLQYCKKVFLLFL